MSKPSRCYSCVVMLNSFCSIVSCRQCSTWSLSPLYCGLSCSVWIALLALLTAFYTHPFSSFLSWPIRSLCVHHFRVMFVHLPVRSLWCSTSDLFFTLLASRPVIVAILYPPEPRLMFTIGTFIRACFRKFPCLNWSLHIFFPPTRVRCHPL